MYQSLQLMKSFFLFSGREKRGKHHRYGLATYNDKNTLIGDTFFVMRRLYIFQWLIVTTGNCNDDIDIDIDVDIDIDFDILKHWHYCSQAAVQSLLRLISEQDRMQALLASTKLSSSSSYASSSSSSSPSSWPCSSPAASRPAYCRAGSPKRPTERSRPFWKQSYSLWWWWWWPWRWQDIIGTGKHQIIYLNPTLFELSKFCKWLLGCFWASIKSDSELSVAKYLGPFWDHGLTLLLVISYSAPCFSLRWVISVPYHMCRPRRMSYVLSAMSDKCATISGTYSDCAVPPYVSS